MADISALSAEDQNKVKVILQGTGLLEHSGLDLPEGPEALSFPGSSILCEIACSTAQAAATAARATLGPIGAPLCIAAATAAGDACRKAC